MTTHIQIIYINIIYYYYNILLLVGIRILTASNHKPLICSMMSVLLYSTDSYNVKLFYQFQ